MAVRMCPISSLPNPFEPDYWSNAPAAQLHLATGMAPPARCEPERTLQFRASHTCDRCSMAYWQVEPWKWSELVLVEAVAVDVKLHGLQLDSSSVGTITVPAGCCSGKLSNSSS